MSEAQESAAAARALMARHPVFDAHVDSIGRAVDLGHDLGERGLGTLAYDMEFKTINLDSNILNKNYHYDLNLIGLRHYIVEEFDNVQTEILTHYDAWENYILDEYVYWEESILNHYNDWENYLITNYPKWENSILANYEKWESYLVTNYEKWDSAGNKIFKAWKSGSKWIEQGFDNTVLRTERIWENGSLLADKAWDSAGNYLGDLLNKAKPVNWDWPVIRI